MKTLDGSVTLYVPQRLFDAARFSSHLNRIAADIGGYTATEVMGGWRGHDGSIVDEEIVCVEVLFSAEQTKLVDHRFSLMIVWLLQQGEEAVLCKTGTGQGFIYYKSDISALLQQSLSNA